MVRGNNEEINTLKPSLKVIIDGKDVISHRIIYILPDPIRPFMKFSTVSRRRCEVLSKWYNFMHQLINGNEFISFFVKT